VAGIFSNMSAA